MISRGYYYGNHRIAARLAYCPVKTGGRSVRRLRVHSDPFKMSGNGLLRGFGRDISAEALLMPPVIKNFRYARYALRLFRCPQNQFVVLAPFITGVEISNLVEKSSFNNRKT